MMLGKSLYVGCMCSFSHWFSFESSRINKITIWMNKKKTSTWQIVRLLAFTKYRTIMWLMQSTINRTIRLIKHFNGCSGLLILVIISFSNDLAGLSLLNNIYICITSQWNVDIVIYPPYLRPLHGSATDNTSRITEQVHTQSQIVHKVLYTRHREYKSHSLCRNN